MASNDDKFEAMMRDFSMLETGNSNLSQEKQMELIDNVQTEFNDMLTGLRDQLSPTAHRTASEAYPHHESFQLQDSDMEDINLRDAGSSGSDSSSFDSMSSYSAASERSNSSRRRQLSSTPTPPGTPQPSDQEGSRIIRFMRTIRGFFKRLWHLAEEQGNGSICKTMFYFLRNIVMNIFSGLDNSVTDGNRYALRHTI